MLFLLKALMRRKRFSGTGPAALPVTGGYLLSRAGDTLTTRSGDQLTYR